MAKGALHCTLELMSTGTYFFYSVDMIVAKFRIEKNREMKLRQPHTQNQALGELTGEG